MMCHQKIIRDRQAEVEHKENLFGAYWENIDLSRQNARIEEVTYHTAKEVILKYEWLGTMPTAFRFAYGLFFGWTLAGVECFTDIMPGAFQSFNKEPAVCIVRGACVHWAPKWAGSFLVSHSVKKIDSKKYKWVVAYSDTDAGEIGTIYQACNWFCVGTIKNIFWESPKGDRKDRSHHRHISRKRINGRRVVVDNKHIENKKKLLSDGWVLKEGGCRYKYVFPLGSGKEFRLRKKYLESIAIPYPKRESVLSLVENH